MSGRRRTEEGGNWGCSIGAGGREGERRHMDMRWRAAEVERRWGGGRAELGSRWRGERDLA